MSVLTELEAELNDKVAEYRAAKSGPNYSADGRSWDHVGYRKSLLEDITQLRLLIQQEGGSASEIRTQIYG